MTATHFHLVTDWPPSLPARRRLVHPDRAEDWPSWWRAVARVERLEDGDADHNTVMRWGEEGLVRKLAAR